MHTCIVIGVCVYKHVCTYVYACMHALIAFEKFYCLMYVLCLQVNECTVHLYRCRDENNQKKDIKFDFTVGVGTYIST